MHSDPSDRSEAEALLYELATRLRGLPLAERTRALHLRALELKRAVAAWTDQAPDDDVRQGICNEIRSLQDEARRSSECASRPTLVFPRSAP